MVRHIVFWKIKDDDNKQVNLEQMKQLLLGLTSNINGVVSTEIGFNFSSSDYDLILDAVFSDPFSLKQYQSHPDIVRIKNFTEPILIDKVVCDYMISSPETVNKNMPNVNFSKTEPQAPSSSSARNAADDSMRNPNYVNGIATPSKNDGPMTIANAPRGNLANTNPLNNVISTLNKSLINPKRDTLAMTPNNLNDDAFALPYERNYKPTEDSFSLPSYGNNNRDINGNQPQNMQPGYGNQSQNMQPGYSNQPNMNGQPGMGNQPSMNSQPQNMQTGMPPMQNNMGGQPQNMQPGYGNQPNMNIQTNMSGQPNMGNQANINGQSNMGNQPNMNGQPQSMQSGMPPMQNNIGVQPQNMQSGYGNQPNMNGQPGMGIQPGMNAQPQNMQSGMSPMQNNMGNQPQNGMYGNMMDSNMNSQNDSRPPARQNRQYSETMAISQNNMAPNQQNNFGYSTEMLPNLNIPDLQQIPPRSRRPQNGPRPDNSTYGNSVELPWKCPQCGKLNPAFSNMCGCGRRKPQMRKNNDSPNNSRQQPNRNRAMPNLSLPGPEAPSNMETGIFDRTQSNSTMKLDQGNSSDRTINAWVCPSCGKVNGDFIGMCGCGQKKPSRNDTQFNNQYQQQQVPPPRKSFGRQKNNGYRNVNENPSVFNNRNVNSHNNQMNVGNDSYYNDPNIYDMEEPAPPVQRNQQPRRNDNNWKCPRCGKIHGNFVGQCGCGQRKPSRNNMAY